MFKNNNHSYQLKRTMVPLLLASLLIGCRGGEQQESLSAPDSPSDIPVEVVARDALFTTKLAEDDYIIDLKEVVLSEGSKDSFELKDVFNIDNTLGCDVTSITKHSFSVSRKSAKVCDFQYNVVATENGKLAKADSRIAGIRTKSHSVDEAAIRVVVSNADKAELPPLSQVTLINEANSSYKPLLIDLEYELNKLHNSVDVSDFLLSPVVSQPYNNGSTLIVDVVNDIITYTPPIGFSGIDRLLYSYTGSDSKVYSGSIDIAVSESVNEGIELLVPVATYDPDAKGYISLNDARNGVNINVDKYVKSLDNDELQLIYVNSLSAPLTTIKTSEASDVTNMTFTFQANTQDWHHITYVVTDHRGSYQIGHVQVLVLDETKLPPWHDVIHTPSGATFYSPRVLSQAVAENLQFSELISARVSGVNYSVAALYSGDIEAYCSQLGAEVATSEEIKSLVDRGWLKDAMWPSVSEYIVRDRISNNLKVLSISAAEYSIDVSTLPEPISSSTSYFPSCVTRTSEPMLTSLQLSATPRSGTTTLSVPKGNSIELTLTGFFSDGSVINDLYVFNSSLTTYVQSNDIFLQTGNIFKGEKVGVSEVYGQFNSYEDPLRSNKAQLSVTDAIVTSSVWGISPNSIPLGSSAVLEGELFFSDGTSKRIYDEPGLIWLLDGTQQISNSVVKEIIRNSNDWILRASDSNQGEVEVSWKIGKYQSDSKIAEVIEAELISLDSIETIDNADGTPSNTFPVGRPFDVNVKATYSNGSRFVSSEPAAEYEYNKSYLKRTDNTFTGINSHGGTKIRFKLEGKSIDKNVTIDTAYLTSLNLTNPQVTSVAKGGTLQMNAIGEFSDGSSLNVNNLNQCTWISSMPSRATVNNTGFVRTNASSAIGDTQISIMCSTPYGNLSDNKTVRVTEAELESIELTPSDYYNVLIFDTFKVKAEGKYSDGTTKDISNSVSWSWASGRDYFHNFGGGTFSPAISVPINIDFTLSANLDGIKSKNSTEVSARRIYKHSTGEFALISNLSSRTEVITRPWFWDDANRACREYTYGGYDWHLANSVDLDAFLTDHGRQIRDYYDSASGQEHPLSSSSTIWSSTNGWGDKKKYVPITGGSRPDSWKNTNRVPICYKR